MIICSEDRREIVNLIASIHTRYRYRIKKDERESFIYLTIDSNFLMCSADIKKVIWYLIGFRDALFLEKHSREER